MTVRINKHWCLGELEGHRERLQWKPSLDSFVSWTQRHHLSRSKDVFGSPFANLRTLVDSLKAILSVARPWPFHPRRYCLDEMFP
jgi:hypothetical protein